LTRHARGSAQENKMRDTVDNLSDASAFTDEDCKNIADARKALHAIVETNDLVVRWLRRQGIFHH
jgi:hypothetical protein